LAPKRLDRSAGISAAARATYSWEYVDDRFRQTPGRSFAHDEADAALREAANGGDDPPREPN
jgi:hypothetical protein